MRKKIVKGIKLLFGAVSFLFISFLFMQNQSIKVYASSGLEYDGITFDKEIDSDITNGYINGTLNGNYYLTADITISGSNIQLRSYNHVNICLNGHTITFTDVCFSIGADGHLGLYDTDTTPHYWKEGADGLWVPSSEETEYVTYGGYVTSNSSIENLIKNIGGEVETHNVDFVGVNCSGTIIYSYPQTTATISNKFLDNTTILGCKAGECFFSLETLVLENFRAEHNVCNSVSTFYVDSLLTVGDNVVVKNNIQDTTSKRISGLALGSDASNVVNQLNIKEGVTGTSLDVYVSVRNFSETGFVDDYVITQARNADLTSIFTLASAVDGNYNATAEKNFFIRSIQNEDGTYQTHITRWHTVTYQDFDNGLYRTVGASAIVDNTKYIDHPTMNPASVEGLKVQMKIDGEWTDVSATVTGWVYKRNIGTKNETPYYVTEEDDVTTDIDIVFEPTFTLGTLEYNLTDGKFYSALYGTSEMVLSHALDTMYTATVDKDGYYTNLTFNYLVYAVEGLSTAIHIPYHETPVIITLNGSSTISNFLKGQNTIDAAPDIIFKGSGALTINGRYYSPYQDLEVRDGAKLYVNSTSETGCAKPLDCRSITVKDTAEVYIYSFDNEVSAFRVENFEGTVVLGSTTCEETYQPLPELDEENDAYSSKVTVDGVQTNYTYIKLVAFKAIEQPTVENNYEFKTNGNPEYQWYLQKESIVTVTDDNKDDCFDDDVFGGTIDDNFNFIVSEVGTIYFYPSFGNYITIKSKTNIDITTEEQQSYESYGIYVTKTYDEVTLEYTYKITLFFGDDFNCAALVAPEGTVLYDLKIYTSELKISGATGSTYQPTEAGSYYVKAILGETVLTSNSIVAYGVNFDTQGANETIDNLANFTGMNVEMPTALTKNGFTFLGWNTNQNATEALTFTDGTYTVGDSDVTFYAIWEVALTPVASIESTKYTSLSDAFDAANASSVDCTITLLDDVTVTTELTIEEGSKTITLDLNDHLINLSTTGCIINYGTLIVIDSSNTKTEGRKFTDYHCEHGVMLNVYCEGCEGPAKQDGSYDNYVGIEYSNSQVYIQVKGGVIYNGSKNGAFVNYGQLTIDGINIIGNYNRDRYAGGAIYNSATLKVYNSYIAGNSADNGGAIYNNEECYLEIVKTTFEKNSAQKGGAIMNNGGVLYLNNVVIRNNTATLNGGGIYTSEYDMGQCLAEGTLITMADGSIKRIEDITPGDVVKSYDHEAHQYVTNAVYYVYEGDTQATPIRLTFASGTTLDIVGCHDLFNKEALKYVTITSTNYTEFINKYFYNTEIESYDKLISVTELSESVHYYSIYVVKSVNCIANGMLSVADDTDYLLNLYTFNEDLSIDVDQLNDDIETYGYYSVQDCAVISAVDYYNFNMKYYNIIIGKGLMTREQLLGNYSQITTTGDATSKAYKGGTVIFEGQAQIYDNKVGDTDNNLYIAEGSMIVFPYDKLNGSVYVTLGSTDGTGVLANTSNTDILTTIMSDNTNYKVVIKNNELKVDAPYTITYDTVGGNSIESTTGFKLPTLPIPTYEGYAFAGWYYTYDSESKEYDDPALTDDAITDNVTLYAKWLPVHECDGVTFDRVILPYSGTLSSGNYYLYEDVTLTRTLNIAPGSTVTICLNGKVLSGNDARTIIYNQGNLTICDCQDTTHKFKLDSEGKLVLDEEDGTIAYTGGVLTRGYNTNGGAIFNVGILNISNINIVGNNQSSFGAILNVNSDAYLTMTDCVLEYNNAVKGSALTNYCAQATNINNCKFANNTGGAGLGIYNYSSEVTIINSSFDNNVASEYGGAIYSEYCTLTITGSTFTNNEAKFGGSILSMGTTLTITDSTFEENSATQSGGAIYVEGNRTNITGSTFGNNTSAYGGGIYSNGEIITITGSTFEENKATYGGAVYTYTGTLNITNTLISNNTSSVGALILVGTTTTLGDGTVVKNNSSTSSYPSGGVYLWHAQDMTFTITGKVIITNNTTVYNEITTTANLCFDGETQIDFVTISELSEGSSIGVTTLANDVITGMKFTTNGATTDLQYFFSDDPHYGIEFDTDHLITKTYTVSFDKMGHGADINTAYVPLNGLVTQPENPTETNYAFGGWYKEEACENAWDFATDTVTANITLYAKWTEKSVLTITETAQSKDYTASGVAFDIKGTTVDDFKIEYYIDGEWTTTKPVDLGTYNVKVSREEDGSYKAFETTITNGLKITKGNATITVDTTTITKIYGEAVTLPTATSNLGTVTCDKTASDLVNAGTYTVTYTVEGTDNYNGATKTLTVVIKAKSIDNIPQGGTTPNVIIEAENGFDPNVTVEIKIEVVAGQVEDGSTLTIDYATQLAKNETLSGVYDVKLLLNGIEIPVSELGANETITVKMLIPTELIGKTFRIIHVHDASDVTEIKFGEEAGIGTYIIDDNGYLVTKIDRLSEFAFIEVHDNGLSVGAIVGIVIGSLLGLLLIIYILGYFFCYRRGHLDDSAIRIVYKWLPRGNNNKKNSKDTKDESNK